MAERKPADWEAIEREYRAAQLSVSEIARQHGLSEGAIRKRANRDGWQKDLSRKVQQAVRAGLVRDGTSGKQDDELVLEKAFAGIEVVRSHRADISQLRSLTTTLADRLAQHLDGIKEDGPGIGEKESAADMLMKLTSIRAKIIPLERQAFNLDDKDESGMPDHSFTIKIGQFNGVLSGQKPNDRTLNYERPWVYEKQNAAIFEPKDSFGDPARYSFTEASTKTGKTVGCIAWLFEQALLGKSGQNYWWVAPVFGQAQIAFRRMRTGLPPDLFSAIETPPTITLINGAIIMFKSGEKPDGLYGEDVYAAVLDEASRMREEAWHALRSTLTATRGPVRIIGNVKGRKNWFFGLCRRAEAGEKGMSYHKLIAADAVDAGVLAAEEVEDAQRMLPEQVFRELYLAEPSEDGGNPFGIGAIGSCVSPMSSGKPVAWGWDLAKHVDWSVGIALDADGRVCRYKRFQTPWEETTATIIRETGMTPALVDSTGVGDPILERLQKTPGSRFEGYQFTSPSKQKLMEGLALAIQQNEVSFPDGPIRMELENFEYQTTRTGVRYSAPEGFHDDCVCALALAVMHKGHARAPMVISDDVLKRSARPGSFSFRI